MQFIFQGRQTGRSRGVGLKCKSALIPLGIDLGTRPRSTRFQTGQSGAFKFLFLSHIDPMTNIENKGQFFGRAVAKEENERDASVIICDMPCNLQMLPFNSDSNTHGRSKPRRLRRPRCRFGYRHHARHLLLFSTDRSRRPCGAKRYTSLCYQ
jgi:hypothetical protein